MAKINKHRDNFSRRNHQILILNRASYLLKHHSYIPTEYYVRSDKQSIYIPIPKVACTSIKEAFYEVEDSAEDYSEYMDIHSSLSMNACYTLNAAQIQYFKFAFVRSPFDRLVSCYKDKVQKNTQHNGRYYFDTRYAQVLLRAFSGIKFNPSMSFSEFVVAVSRIPDFIADGHFRSQYHYLYQVRNYAPEYVGRFEDIEKDWELVRQRINLPHLKVRNSSETTDLCEWFSDIDLIRLVRDRYRLDIETWYLDEYHQILDAAKEN